MIRRLAGLCRGVRVIVSGGLEMSLVAAGRLDAFIGLKADIVSHAAAMPLVRAAGGKVTTVDGVGFVMSTVGLTRVWVKETGSVVQSPRTSSWTLSCRVCGPSWLPR